MDGASERNLHNFTLLSQLKCGHQKHLRCVKSLQTSSSTSGSPSKKTPEGKPLSTISTMPSAAAAASARGNTTNDIESVCKKLVSDLKVTVDDHLKLRIFYDHEKDQRSYNHLQEGAKKPSEEGLPWSLRSRPTAGKTGRGSLTPAMQQSQKGIDGEVSRSSTWLQKPKFSATLSNEEIETDFLLLTGAKPSRRPKKRSRTLQKQFDRLFPVSWVTKLTSEKYKVHEHPEPKQSDK